MREERVSDGARTKNSATLDLGGVLGRPQTSKGGTAKARVYRRSIALFRAMSISPQRGQRPR